MPDKLKTPPKPAQPLQFGKPEKRNWTTMIIGIAFVVVCLALIGWMIGASKPMHALSCDSGASGGPTRFGGCQEE